MLENANPEEVTETQHGDPYVPIKGDYYLEETERPGEFLQLDEDENGTYLMNARDLCGIEHLEEMRDAGVISFKVEGRSKSIYYVAMVARAYRRAIDDLKSGKPFDPSHLEEIYSTSNRGLIAGFLKGNPGHTAQNFEDGRSKASTYRFSGVMREYDEDKKWMKIEARNPIRRGMSIEMALPEQTVTFTVDELYDAKMQDTEIVHGGVGHCWIPYPHNPGPFVILREQLKEPAATPAA